MYAVSNDLFYLVDRQKGILNILDGLLCKAGRQYPGVTVQLDIGHEQVSAHARVDVTGLERPRACSLELYKAEDVAAVFLRERWSPETTGLVLFGSIGPKIIVATPRCAVHISGEVAIQGLKRSQWTSSMMKRRFRDDVCRALNV